MAQTKQTKRSVRCAGTTYSGDRCRNRVDLDPKNPGQWKAKRCGRCVGPSMVPDIHASSGWDLSLDDDEETRQAPGALYR